MAGNMTGGGTASKIKKSLNASKSGQQLSNSGKKAPVKTSYATKLATTASGPRSSKKRSVGAKGKVDRPSVTKKPKNLEIAFSPDRDDSAMNDDIAPIQEDRDDTPIMLRSSRPSEKHVDQISDMEFEGFDRASQQDAGSAYDDDHRSSRASKMSHHSEIANTLSQAD